jgi:MFS family permease
MAIVEPRRSLAKQQSGPETLTGEQRRWRMPFLGLVALQSMTNMFFFIMPTQLPFFLDAQGYDSATLTGMTLSVLMLTGGCMALLYTRIQRAINYAGVFAFGYAAMAAGFLLLVLSPPVFVTFAGAGLIGAGYALVAPTFVTLTLHLAPPHRRGVAGGILTASVFIGQFCSPLLSTPAVSGFGYDGLFLGAVAVLTLMATAALSSTLMRSR